MASPKVDTIQQEINLIIDKIRNQVYFNDEDIENDLKGLLEQLEDENRREIIQSLHKQFPEETFLNLSYFAQISNNEHGQKYSENLKEKKFDKILQELKNERYYEYFFQYQFIFNSSNIVNQLIYFLFLFEINWIVPISIKDYLIPIQKLGNDLHLIFELIEVVKQKGQPNFLSVLKLLINLFLLECDNEIKGQIHQFVGSLLEKQIYKFEYYVAQVLQKEQIKNQFIDCIYKVQIQEISVQQGKDILLQNCSDKQILFLFELFTLKLGSHSDNLLGFMKNLIYLKNKKINKDDLISYLSLTENFNENLDYLYFKLVFYFWIQFIELFKLKDNILNFENKLPKSQQKKVVLENGIKHLNSKEKNMIYRYLIQKIIYYSNLEDQDFRENQNQYEAQEKEFIKKFDQFKLQNIKKVNEFAEISKELMFYQLKFLQNHIQNQQSDFTKEIHILTFLATNNLNKNLETFLIKNIQSNFKDCNDQELNRFSKEQKINLLHLEQSLKGKIQIKMSRFVNQNEIFNQYPKQLQIKMEEFNISLTSKNQMDQNVDQWLKDKTNKENFKKLLPYYFNIIKRGESPEELLSLINKNVIQKHESRRNETLNLKSLFQLLYNNSDKELQMMLLKIHSKNHPVPLLYQNPQLQKDNISIKDCYVLNANIFYLLSNDFPIINFSLTQKVNQFGKSELINMLFYIDYKDQKFEISDSSSINNNSVDCQFDFSFNGSRNYLIADVHGQLEDEILQELLPFFQLWIIQMQTEDEFEENVDKLIVLCEKMKLLVKPKIILIIRDSKQKELNQEKCNKLKKTELDFQIYPIPNLQQQENKAIEKDERAKIKKFILQQIGTKNETIQEVQIQESFLKICKAFNVNEEENKKSQKILKDLTDELNKIIQKDNGFYQIEAFPLRNLAWQIKSYKQYCCNFIQILKLINQQLIQQLNYTKLQSEQELEKKQNAINDIKNEKSSDLNEKLKQKEIENKIKQTQEELIKITNEIDNIEDKKQKQDFKESQLIKQFSLIFKQDNYYITYLRFVEHIAKFNQENLKKLNIKIEDLRQQLDSLKEEQKKERRDLEQNLKTLENKYIVQNISIELFWREVIKGNRSFQQSPINIVCQLIKKGEPFEFLNGDDLTIDSNFLIQLKEKLLDKDDNKILFLSILGPQSSGKSTLLNRIFGCHFLTSMGRCTKGLFLQLLKISNKEQFKNSFDYILLLDSEGLQNPNQQDPEFDKKISLFIIQISDILIFNVKGEIHSTFHNLIEVSFYTLAKYSKLKFLKQFSWCFNQNNQINGDEKFKLLKQIEDIGQKLNSEKNLIEEDDKQIDYVKHLDITKKNIYILGMATNSQEWHNDSNYNQFQEIKQEINLQDYSKNALSFGIEIINKFIHKYEQTQHNHHEILTCFYYRENKLDNAFLLRFYFKVFSIQFSQFKNFQKFFTSSCTKVQQCWEIVSKLPDLVEFSDLKEQKDYETINKIATEKMAKANEKFQDFDTIIQQIQAKSEHENSLENYNQIQKDVQQDFLQQCYNQKDEILNELQHEYSYSIISDAIRKKVEGNIAEVYYAIGLEGSLIILQKIHQLRRKFQYSLVPAKIQQTVNQILNDSEQLKILQENISMRNNKFEQIWNELVESSNQEVENLHTEFQKKLFDCFLKYKKQYQYKAEDLEDQIDYFVRQINNQDPNTQKENQMEKICSLFLKDFQLNSFNTLNKQSKQQFQQIFDEDILIRLDNLPKPPFIDPWKYLKKETTFQVIEKKKIVQLLKENLKQKLTEIIIETKGNETQKLEIQELFTTLKQLPIQFDQNILKEVLDLIKEDFSKLKEILKQNYQQKILQHTQIQLSNANQQLEGNQYSIYPSRFQGSVEKQGQQKYNFCPPQPKQFVSPFIEQLQLKNQAAVEKTQQRNSTSLYQYQQDFRYQYFTVLPYSQNLERNSTSQSQYLQNFQASNNLQSNQTTQNPSIQSNKNLPSNQIFTNPSSIPKQVQQPLSSKQGPLIIDNLIESLKESQTQSQPINIFSLNYIQQQFPGLKDYQEKKQMNDKDKTQYFILKEHVSIKFKQSIEKSNYQCLFNYIISQKSNQTEQKDFQSQFPSIFVEIMTENQGWNKLCQKIYDIIQKQFDETQLSQPKLQQQSSDIFQILFMDEDVTQYSRKLLQGIIKKVENQLEQINKELAFFGIEFSPLFIRKLQFYSFFIIWRFICYDKLNMYKKEQNKFLENYAIVKNKYENAILKNQKKESQDQGQQQAKIIYKLCIIQFYKDKKINVNKQINLNKKTSSQLIKELDQQLLIIRKENILKDQNVEASIIEYLSDQSGFMKKYIEQLVLNLQKTIEIQIEIQPFVQESLNLITNNSKILQLSQFIFIFFNLTYIDLNFSFFKLENDIQTKLYQKDSQQLQDWLYGYEDQNLSLNQILKYILGQDDGKVEQNLYKQIFFPDQSIKQINLQIEQIQQNDYISVQFLETFLEEFIKQISILFDESKTLETSIDEFQLKGKFEEMKNIMNGCDQSCPTCNRKCDSEFYQEDHKHKCTNGHQLRGMNKILIRNSPSLFTCEEIVDDADIQIEETRKIKTWREIKAYYKNWSFKDILQTEELQQNKQKMIEIWNGGIGQQICQELSKELKYEIRYQQKHDLPMHQQHSSTHYIFILDDSGSMINHWKSVIKCVESQFQEISRKINARVSVVIFNTQARIVVKCEELRIEEQLKLLIFQNGGGTNYGPAFLQTLELLKEYPEFDNSIILFYTDGLAEYPKKEIEQFSQIQKRMRDSIYFLACSQPNKSPSLEQILTFCKREFTYSEWREKIEPHNLNKNWTEMISQAHLDKYKA